MQRTSQQLRLAARAGGLPQPTDWQLVGGFQRALVTCSILLLVAAGVALRATDTRGEANPGRAPEPVPDAA